MSNDGRKKMSKRVRGAGLGQSCRWGGQELTGEMKKYHDEEWGVVVEDDVHLFEMLTLEGAQSGLSWSTILSKRTAYREAYLGFHVPLVAALTDDHLEALLLPSSQIVRHRPKVLAPRHNAQLILNLPNPSFSHYIWGFLEDWNQQHFGVRDRRPLMHQQSMPTQNPLSQIMATKMKKDGFKFVGPTTMYAFMQAIGMCHDHEPQCYCFQPGIGRVEEEEDAVPVKKTKTKKEKKKKSL